MNSKERLLAALRREPVDRVPANITYYIADFYDTHLAPRLVHYQDPFEARLASQTIFGFDPLVGLGGAEHLPWRMEEPGRWEVAREVARINGDTITTYTVTTPAGTLRTLYGERPGHSGWQIEPLIKEEGDLDCLACLPEPRVDRAALRARWEQLGERGLGYVGINGIWQQACYLRGMEQMAMDPYLDPAWTHRFLGLLCDWLAKQAELLCQSPVETFFINESYVGMGLSRKVFDGFVKPYDERLTQVAKKAGKYVLYHDCGKANALLESMVDIGIDYLEPITPTGASGDLDPADVKRRIGGRVCLRGGVNHEIVTHGTPQEIRAEVRRCLDILAPGGGYILCPSAPFDLDVPLENLEAFAQAAQDYCGEYGGL
ncbi:MAG: hypothetical protein H5T69_01850 [Chloroflexi bacterium]|nr:hypothetical protein [Chloroflexota bacterium]